MMMVENRNCKCQEIEDENNNNEKSQVQKYEMSGECNQRREMAMKIREYEFAITELALYLDTHPEDQKPLCLHRKYCKECKELKDKYQKVYGPLTINYPCNKWRWLEEPWPWERGNY